MRHKNLLKHILNLGSLRTPLFDTVSTCTSTPLDKLGMLRSFKPFLARIDYTTAELYSQENIPDTASPAIGSQDQQRDQRRNVADRAAARGSGVWY